MKLVPQQFFPNSSRPELLIDLRMKEGSSFAATSEQVKRLEAVLKRNEDVRFFTAYTGGGSPRFYLSLNPELPNPGYAQFVVMTKDAEARERVRSGLIAGAPQDFPEAWLRVTRLELGPAVGYPVQFRVIGPDTQQVRRIARDVERSWRRTAMCATSSSTGTIPCAMRVELDQDRRARSASRRQNRAVTQTLMNGATLSQLREREDLIDIVARAVPEERLDLDTLKDVNIYTRQGTVVPLSQVARVRYELEEPVLWRRNRDMAITVRADVNDGEQAVSVTQEIRPLLKDIEAKLPSGYRIDVGGASEEMTRRTRRSPRCAGDACTILAIYAAVQSFSRWYGGYRSPRPDRACRRSRTRAPASSPSSASSLAVLYEQLAADRPDPDRDAAGLDPGVPWWMRRASHTPVRAPRRATVRRCSATRSVFCGRWRAPQGAYRRDAAHHLLRASL